MLSAVKTLARTSRPLAQQEASNFQRQSQRLVGDLPVKTNKYIEDWSTFREHLEDTFKFDGPTLTKLALWGVGAPVFLYTTIVGEFNTADSTAGRKKKDFM